jgi:hypothetical protein
MCEQSADRRCGKPDVTRSAESAMASGVSALSEHDLDAGPQYPKRD